jgi:hypothetical protein
MHPEVNKRRYGWVFFNKRLACIVTGSQPIGLFSLGIHFDQTQIHKTNDFNQIQNLLDQDSGRNATTTERFELN